MNLDVLFKVNDFCAKHKIEFQVTGTTALFLLGVPSYFPNDLDIKVFHATDEQKAKLQELQELSGAKPEIAYAHSDCYTFYVNGVKVNVIIDNKLTEYDAIAQQEVLVQLLDEKASHVPTIGVQKIDYALRDKMALGRAKDRKYMLKLINNLTNL